MNESLRCFRSYYRSPYIKEDNIEKESTAHRCRKVFTILFFFFNTIHYIVPDNTNRIKIRKFTWNKYYTSTLIKIITKGLEMEKIVIIIIAYKNFHREVID